MDFISGQYDIGLLDPTARNFFVDWNRIAFDAAAKRALDSLPGTRFLRDPAMVAILGDGPRTVFVAGAQTAVGQLTDPRLEADWIDAPGRAANCHLSRRWLWFGSARIHMDITLHDG